MSYYHAIESAARYRSIDAMRLHKRKASTSYVTLYAPLMYHLISLGFFIVCLYLVFPFSRHVFRHVLLT